MTISAENLIILIIVGALAGFLASRIMRTGIGLLGMILIGVIGAFLGAWLLGLFGLTIAGGWLATFINAFIGALVLLLLVSLIRR